jgi:hypothetical protein
MDMMAYHAILRRLGVEPTDAWSRPEPREVARLLVLPLDRFARTGQPLELRVPWLSLTLWLVPDELHADALTREGIGRGRIWTAGEMVNLLSIPDLTTDQARTITDVKIQFGGDVVSVRPRKVAAADEAVLLRKEG